MAMLEIKDLHVHYGVIHALKGVSMQVEQGERYLMSREEALDKIATFTGGRAAEELIFRVMMRLK